MRWITMTAMLAITVIATGRTVASEGQRLQGALGVMEPWLGTWQIEAEWSGGGTLWAQSEYRPLLDGAFLEGRVFVRDNGGELYQRYHTIMAWDAASGRVAVVSFNHDGSVAPSALEVDGSVVTSSWVMDATTIDERLEAGSDGDRLHWQVWATPAGGERSQIMDGTWRRVDAEPIELPTAELAPGVTALEPLLGGWETAGDPAQGEPPWSRVAYRSGLGGRFVEAASWTADSEGAWKQAEATVIAAGADPEHLTLTRFAADGSVTPGLLEVQRGDAGTELVIASDPAAGAAVRERLALAPPDAFRRQVWRRDSPDGEWRASADARWQRQGAAEGHRAAVDPARFVAAGDELRSLVKQATIPAPAAVVWAAWTDAEAWGRLWGAPSRGNFDLAVGGAYEWLFDGEIGGNGDQVLSWIPGRMLSFSWNAPPSQPHTRLARTWVVVELEPDGDGATQVRLTHLGFGDGPEWDQTYAYFDSAWERVLTLMAAKLGAPADSRGD